MLIDANRFDLLEELILAEPLRHGQPVVLIDGRSGAGKTTLANTLICHHADWQLVHADDLYPGWSGLSAVWDLRDLVARRRYRRWDWYQNRFDDEVILNANRPLVIEGCGVLTPTNAPLASLRVWCEVSAPLRRHRALARTQNFATSGPCGPFRRGYTSHVTDQLISPISPFPDRHQTRIRSPDI